MDTAMSPKDDFGIRISADNKVTEQLDPYVDPRVALIAEAKDLFEKANDLTFDGDELRYIVIQEMPRFAALAERIGRPGAGLVTWAGTNIPTTPDEAQKFYDMGEHPQWRDCESGHPGRTHEEWLHR